MKTQYFLKPNYAASHALIIGIDRYQYASPLSQAVSDAKGFRNALIESCNFDESKIRLLLNEEATRQGIMSAYHSYTSYDINVDDRLVIFFAGHGDTATGNRGEIGFLVPHDANQEDRSTLIAWNEITHLTSLIPAKHILFIMDCCYSGLILTRSNPSGGTRFVRDMLRRPARQVITAGKANEVVSDDGGPITGHSVFTGHLIEGLTGKASNSDGILTANILMSYVYQNVAKDGNSTQTPHYGYLEGDGDFIFNLPDLSPSEESDADKFFVIPAVEEILSVCTLDSKIARVKKLLSRDDSSIELHDFLLEEVQLFQSNTSEDNFANDGHFTEKEFAERIERYSHATTDLAALLACVAYWSRATHSQLIEKVLLRSVDRLQTSGGLVAWLRLRWFPSLALVYAAGIAAVASRNYSALTELLSTRVGKDEYQERNRLLIDIAVESMHEGSIIESFRKLPEFERHYTPVSNYLHRFLQPIIEDALRIGRSYEDAFSEFEVFLSLSISDGLEYDSKLGWGPFGRFAWSRYDDSDLTKLIRKATHDGDNWRPLKEGLFGGSASRFIAVAEKLNDRVNQQGWR